MFDPQSALTTRQRSEFERVSSMVGLRALWLFLILFVLTLLLSDHLWADEVDRDDDASAGGELDFAALADRYVIERDRFYREVENVTDPDARIRAFAEHDPANTMFNEFLDLERGHRGTKVGFSALYHLVSVAFASYGCDPAYPVSEAAHEALQRLAEHYTGEPDLDVVFWWLSPGPCGDDARALLERAADSPHRHVRGAALFTSADKLANQAETLTMLGGLLDLTEDNPDQFQTERTNWIRLRETLGSIDPDVARKSALRMFEQVAEEYGDILETPRFPDGLKLVNVERSGIDEISGRERRSLAELAEQKRSAITTLAIGQTAPEIDGPDAFGQQLKLSDHYGEVVVLMFSFKGCVPCEAMYPRNRELVKMYHDRPFRLLGVMGDEELATVEEAVREEKITWDVWWDGSTQGPIHSRWNVESWPEIYVLDHHGVIRYRKLRGELLAHAVAKLVAEAEKDFP